MILAPAVSIAGSTDYRLTALAYPVSRQAVLACLGRPATVSACRESRTFPMLYRASLGRASHPAFMPGWPASIGLPAELLIRVFMANPQTGLAFRRCPPISSANRCRAVHPLGQVLSLIIRR